MSAPAYPTGFFVTGTDTGVGKTAVTAALAAALARRGVDVGVMKPVQTGAIPTGGVLRSPDAGWLAAAAGVLDPPEWVCPVRFAAPLAPELAAAREGQVIAAGSILRAWAELRSRHAIMLVEGAGGLLVPITPEWTVAHLAQAIGLPLLVVARCGLGTINHTCLTVRTARSLSLSVAGIVLNRMPADPDEAERGAPDAIRRWCAPVPVYVLPDDPAVNEGSHTLGALPSLLAPTDLLGCFLPGEKG